MSHDATVHALECLKQIRTIKGCCQIDDVPPEFRPAFAKKAAAAIERLHASQDALRQADTSAFAGAITELIPPEGGESAKSFHALVHKVARSVCKWTWVGAVIAADGANKAKAELLLETCGHHLLDGERDPPLPRAEEIVAMWPGAWRGDFRSHVAAIDTNWLAAMVEKEAAIVQSTEGGDGPDGATQLERALAMLVADPGQTDKQIAKAVGVHPKTMNKPAWQKYKAARAALKGSIPKGSKSDGMIEAYDE